MVADAPDADDATAGVALGPQVATAEPGAPFAAAPTGHRRRLPLRSAAVVGAVAAVAAAGLLLLAPWSSPAADDVRPPRPPTTRRRDPCRHRRPRPRPPRGRSGGPVRLRHPASVLVADIDGDGCLDALRYADGVLEAAGMRWALGRDGDQVATGDWSCRGVRTVVLLRPSTGEVFRFDAWAVGADEVVTGSRVATVPAGRRCGRRTWTGTAATSWSSNGGAAAAGRPHAAAPAVTRGPVPAAAGWAGGIALALYVLSVSGAGRLAPPPIGSPGRWPAWLERREPASAAFAILRLAAVGGCWYLAATTVVGADPSPAAGRRAGGRGRRLHGGPVRRLLAGSLTLTLAGIGPTAALAAAQPAPTTTTTTRRRRRRRLGRRAAADTITMRRLPRRGPGRSARPRRRTRARGHRPLDGRPGDCFWTIADDVLHRAWGRAPTDAEIVPYWHRLIEANRAELADPGNADLIFPGQVFTVPTPPPAPSPT